MCDVMCVFLLVAYMQKLHLKNRSFCIFFGWEVARFMQLSSILFLSTSTMFGVSLSRRAVPKSSTSFDIGGRTGASCRMNSSSLLTRCSTVSQSLYLIWSSVSHPNHQQRIVASGENNASASTASNRRASSEAYVAAIILLQEKNKIILFF